MSTQFVPRRTWRFIWLGFLLVCLSGVLLVTLSLHGIANPPLGRNLRLHETKLLPDQQPLPYPPLTIILAATNSGSAHSAWGVRMHGVDDQPLTILIDNQGYFSLSFTSPNWQPFLHLRPGRNELYLHVDPNGQIIIRLNEEVAFQQPVANKWSYWQTVTIGEPIVRDIDLQIYTN